MERKSPSLENAYAIETPDDNRRLYADWAETYDADFVEGTDYRMPGRIADSFTAAGGKGPVLDVGAGTGAVAMHLRAAGIAPIDGTDISPEMLAVAAQRQVYRRLFEGDVTARLDVADGTYAGVVSAGTFTLGHVGPDALDELLRVAAPGALFAISIHRAHFENAGFSAKLDSMQAKIDDLSLTEVRIYGENATGDHAKDTALIARFRKA